MVHQRFIMTGLVAGLCLVAAVAGTGGAVQITVPDTTMATGTEFELPITVDNVTGLGIIAYQFTLTYEKDVLKATGLSLEGCLAGQWGNPTVNSDIAGEVTVVQYSTTPLEGAGTLLRLKMEVTGNPGEESTLRFVPFVCNDGDPQADYSNPAGVFRVKSSGVPVLSVFPDTLDFGSVDTVQYFTVVNVGSQMLEWSVSGKEDIPWIQSIYPETGTSNGVVEVTISRAGLGVGLYTGELPVTSNGGHMNLTMLMTVAQEYDVIAVSVPDTGQYKSRMLELPVTVADVTGMGVIAYEFSLVYDESVVNIVGASAEGSLTAAWGEPTVNTGTAGQITVAHLSSAPLSGAGALVWLICYAVGNPGDSSSLSIERFSFNDGYPLAEWMTPAAVFAVDTADVPLLFLSPTVLDFGATGTVKACNIVNLGVDTLQWSVIENPAQPWIELVSPSSGEGEGPVMIGVSRIGLSAGLYSSLISVVSNGGDGNVTVSMSVPAGTRRIQCHMPDTTVVMDGEVTIPLRVDDLSSFGVYDFDITLLFNESLIQILEVISVGTLSGSWGTPEVDLASPGVANISHQGALPLSGSGTLLSLRMKAIGDPGDSTSLSFSEMRFNHNRDVAQYDTPAAILKILSPQYPVLSVSPSLLDFGTRSTTKSFTIRNVGMDVLRWSVYENPEKTWIFQLYPTDGQQEQTVTVTVSRQGLVPDVYMGSVYVVSNGGYENVAIRMEVQQTDSMPPYLAFTSPPDGAVSVARNSPVYMTIEDRDSQVDVTSLHVQINADTIMANGVDQTGGAVQVYTSETGVTLLYRPTALFNANSMVIVAIHAEDDAHPVHPMDGDFFFNVGQGTIAVSAESTLAPTGGTIEDETGNLLTLPSGALPDSLVVFIGSAGDVPAFPDSFLPVGTAHLFGPDGLVFCPLPGVGRLTYTDDDLANAGISDPLRLTALSFRSNPGVWEACQMLAIDPDSRTVLFQLCRLGYVRLAVDQGTGLDDDPGSAQPDCFSLQPNCPNPFNASTSIQYAVGSGQWAVHVTLKIFNVLGQEVRTLVDGTGEAGSYSVTWDGRDAEGRELSSGIYLCRMVAVDVQKGLMFQAGQRLVLLR